MKRKLSTLMSIGLCFSFLCAGNANAAVSNVAASSAAPLDNCIKPIFSSELIRDFKNDKVSLFGLEHRNLFAEVYVNNKKEGDTRENFKPVTLSVGSKKGLFQIIKPNKITLGSEFKTAADKVWDRQMAFEKKLRLKDAQNLKARKPLNKALKADVKPPVVGEVRKFWVYVNASEQQQRDFTCRAVTNSAYIWEDSADHVLTPALIGDYAKAFDKIIPKDREVFGNDTDTDNDPKIYILFSGLIDNDQGTGFAGGYFTSEDKHPGEHSNCHDMFYMANYGTPRGIEYSKGTLAHEFQHMINYDCHYRHGAGDSEYSWLNEGMSELACYVTGYDSTPGHIAAYLKEPTGITVWEQNRSSYGGSALFTRYLYEKYPAAIKNIVDTGKSGIANVEAATGKDFNTIMKDFFLAMQLSNTGYSKDDRYNFKTLNLRDQKVFGDWMKPTELAIGSGASFEVYPYQPIFLHLSGQKLFSSVQCSVSDSSHTNGEIINLDNNQKP